MKKEAQDIVFLQETRLQVHEFDVLKFNLGFSNFLAMDSDGRGVGLAML